ncbi:hypothetical protein QUF72_11285 [Desulfobacterales bacterium HSG2]|nr:hypothetical protein [Desulfobacterales bacterium HSG2]
MTKAGIHYPQTEEIIQRHKNIVDGIAKSLPVFWFGFANPNRAAQKSSRGLPKSPACIPVQPKKARGGLPNPPPAFWFCPKKAREDCQIPACIPLRICQSESGSPKKLATQKSSRGIAKSPACIPVQPKKARGGLPNPPPAFRFGFANPNQAAQKSSREIAKFPPAFWFGFANPNRAAQKKLAGIAKSPPVFCQSEPSSPKKARGGLPNPRLYSGSDLPNPNRAAQKSSRVIF